MGQQPVFFELGDIMCSSHSLCLKNSLTSLCEFQVMALVIWSQLFIAENVSDRIKIGFKKHHA